MPRGAGQVPDRGLQGIEAVVRRHPGVPPEGDDRRRRLQAERGGFGPVGASAAVARRRHFGTLVALMPWRLATALALA